MNAFGVRCTQVWNKSSLLTTYNPWFFMIFLFRRCTQRLAAASTFQFKVVELLCLRPAVKQWRTGAGNCMMIPGRALQFAKSLVCCKTKQSAHAKQNFFLYGLRGGTGLCLRDSICVCAQLWTAPCDLGGFRMCCNGLGTCWTSWATMACLRAVMNPN